MSNPELPAAVYAAAGAGELAYQQLRKLPETAARTVRTASETADALREQVRTRVGARDRDVTTGVALVRETAWQGAASLLAQAAAAQERAVTGYRSLVARGERMVNDRLGMTTGHAEPPTRVEAVIGDAAGEPAAEASAADARGVG